MTGGAANPLASDSSMASDDLDTRKAALENQIDYLGSYYADVAALLDDKRDEVRYAAAAAMIRLKQRGPAPPPTRKPS